ncbi:isopentenyl-diphosphate Delta-isomerase [Corynebacterium aquilae]|uniref:Isopentenyl-diphosphate Delta-isomerase n=1 Tax=Corynebacterium aquilae DSM 44791 TaxID=1431546 RepID=A0A1L7CH68_9CORY|nr:isopentenyl-diphosphate Delta-isomerase [Corynebacterium aquilae]APT85212.1 isopentenyl-diphosphate delta-isomerase [Corynebacterium aquilae DSM 44791]
MTELSSTPVELVVLADANGRACGTAPKATVHDDNTPLHFAFSCYVRDEQGKVLVTRRALSKKTWPGVWTNSMCGHPGVGEDPAAALVRRGAEELGVPPQRIGDIKCVLPDFSYRAVDSSGIVEWEICPVYVATLNTGDVAPLPEEVDSFAWVDPVDLVAAVKSTPFAFSPWMVEQLAHPELQHAIGA